MYFQGITRLMNADIDFFRKEYIKQRKLKKYVDSRQIDRPNVKKWQVIISYIAFAVLVFSAIFLPIITPMEIWGKAIVIAALLLSVFEGCLRFCLILTVKCYQRYAKEETRRKCFCVPSCSQYALLSLKKIFPLPVALLKIRKRLFVTCNGEYKIDFPTKKIGKTFENKL